jgi:hypothetical protein
MPKPIPGEYSPYQIAYINTVQEENIFKVLEGQLDFVPKFLSSISEEKGNYAYADGKWTVKQIIGHVIDTERIFAYRSLCIARGEKQTLPGFEQDDFVAAANFNNLKISDLISQFIKVRESNLLLFKSLDDKDFNKRGTVNNYEITVNAILYVIAGHLNHHLKILKEKYLIK